MLQMAIPQLPQQCTNRPGAVAAEAQLLLFARYPDIPNFMCRQPVGIHVNMLSFPDD